MSKDFKTGVGIILGVALAGGVVANQYILSNQIKTLEGQQPRVIVVRPTTEPTATPAATLKVSPSIKPVVSVTQKPRF